MKYAHGWAFPDEDVFMMAELKADGTYQAANLHAALRYVTDWSLAVDGGAHVGAWTKPMAAKFARVIAVEPASDTYEALTANLAAFGCGNVDARHIAIGDKAREVRLVLDGRGATMRNTGARHIEKHVRKGGEVVKCEPIDEWELPTLGFLKLDIEGGEPDAIAGARATIRRCHPVVLFENKGLCVRLGHSRNAVQRLLTELGYRHVESVSCDEIWLPA